MFSFNIDDFQINPQASYKKYVKSSLSFHYLFFFLAIGSSLFKYNIYCNRNNDNQNHTRDYLNSYSLKMIGFQF